MQPSAIIIGSGLTGLTSALALKRQGFSVTVLEKNDRIGGVISSHLQEGFLIEAGPNSMLVKSQAVRDFLDSLQLADQETPANPAANRRFLVRNHKILPLPHSLCSAISTPLYSFPAKLKILLEPWRPSTLGDDTSVAEFVTRRLGPEFLHYAIAPMVSGIFAGDPEELSIRHAFPKVWALEANASSLIRGSLQLRKKRKISGSPKFKSQMISYQRGLSQLVEAIAQQIGHENILTRQSIQSITSTDQESSVLTDQSPTPFTAQHLIVTTPVHQWNSLPLPSEIAAALQASPHPPHPPVATLVLGFHRSQIQHPLNGFGVLIPPIEKMPILGAIFSSSIFPHRAPKDHLALMVFLGGTTQPDAAAWDQSSASQMALSALRPLLGIQGNPTFVHHTQWPQAIPQYTLDHQSFCEAIEALHQKHPRFHLAGSFTGGPGLNDCIQSALNLATQIS